MKSEKMKNKTVMLIAAVMMVAFSCKEDEKLLPVAQLIKAPWMIEDILEDTNGDGDLESVMQDCLKDNVYTFEQGGLTGGTLLADNGTDVCPNESENMQQGYWTYTAVGGGEGMSFDVDQFTFSGRLDKLTNDQLIISYEYEDSTTYINWSYHFKR